MRRHLINSFLPGESWESAKLFTFPPAWRSSWIIIAAQRVLAPTASTSAASSSAPVSADWVAGSQNDIVGVTLLLFLALLASSIPWCSFFFCAMDPENSPRHWNRLLRQLKQVSFRH